MGHPVGLVIRPLSRMNTSVSVLSLPATQLSQQKLKVECYVMDRGEINSKIISNN